MKHCKKYIALCLAAVLAISCLFLFAACEEKDDGRRLVEQDTVFYVEMLESSVNGIPLIFLNPEESYVALRKDGTATFRLVVSDYIDSILGLIGEIGEVDMSVVLDMLYEYLPGLDLTDLRKTLEVFEGGLSLKLLGVDPNNADLQAMFAHMGETGTLPSQLIIPQGFGLEINAPYYIKDVVSRYDGKQYTGVYFGNHHEDGEAFFMADLLTDEETGKTQVLINYDLLNIYIVCNPK